jgi:hypothetical protein
VTWAICQECEEWHICDIHHAWTEWGWWPQFICRKCYWQLYVSEEARQFVESNLQIN